MKRITLPKVPDGKPALVENPRKETLQGIVGEIKLITSGDYQALISEELSGEKIGEMLDGLIEKAEKKCEAIVVVSKELDGRAEIIRGEMKRLQEKVKKIEGNNKRLLAYLKRNLEILGVTVVDTGRFRIRLFKTHPKVECSVPVNELPAVLVKTEITQVLDKEKVLQMFKEGKELPEGITVIDNNLAMRIE